VPPRELPDLHDRAKRGRRGWRRRRRRRRRRRAAGDRSSASAAVAEMSIGIIFCLRTMSFRRGAVYIRLYSYVGASGATAAESSATFRGRARDIFRGGKWRWRRRQSSAERKSTRGEANAIHTSARKRGESFIAHLRFAPPAARRGVASSRPYCLCLLAPALPRGSRRAHDGFSTPLLLRDRPRPLFSSLARIPRFPRSPSAPSSSAVFSRRTPLRPLPREETNESPLAAEE